MKHPSFKIYNAKVVGNAVLSRVDCSDDVKWALKTDVLFFDYYDTPVKIKSVRESILNIPSLSVVAPIAWAVGADIHLNGDIDRNYMDSLYRIKEIFKELYPLFSFSSSIYVNNIITNRLSGSKSGLLFSSGVDSLTSYVKHKKEKLELISVWGTDVHYRDEKFWELVEKHIHNFADSEKVVTHFVRTNLYEDVNKIELGNRFNLDWWVNVSYGLNLLGLCAPLAVGRMKKILFASAGTGKTNTLSGSNPLIVNNILQAGIKSVHDGGRMNRIEKIKYLSNHPQYLQYIRSCYMSKYTSRNKLNCCKCEKCYRTIIPLLLLGIDPKKANFDVSVDVLHNIKKELTTGELKIAPWAAPFWKDIKRQIPHRVKDDKYGSQEFFTWLKEFDIEKTKRDKERKEQT